jgi:hypothetical protein
MTRAGRDPLEHLPAHDALGATAPLAFERTYPVLGIPLRVRSNAVRAIDLADDSFGVWAALDPALVDRGVSVEMRVIVHDGPAHDEALPADDRPPVYRRHGPVLVAGRGATLLTIHLEHRLYVAFVPASRLDRSEWYQWHVNGMARFALSALERHPLHAATWIVNGTAVLVMGPAGSGKSTLAYAALRAGFPLLAEEATHVSITGGLRLWGHADRIALAEDAATHFPELARWPPGLRPSGKVKRAVPTSPFQRSAPLTHHGPLVLCWLTGSHAGPPVVEPLDSDEATSLLTGPLEEGFDQFPDIHQAIRIALAAAPAFRVSTGADPAAAVQQMARSARGT